MRRRNDGAAVAMTAMLGCCCYPHVEVRMR